MATERSVLVRLRADASQMQREMLKARAAVAGVREEIDTTNDRTAWLTQGILAIGPAAITTGATAVPVLMGIASQAVIGAGALGVMALAFNGVIDGVKALNEYQIDPSTKNLEKLNEAMRRLGPDGAAFVQVLDDIGAKLSVLQLDARAEMFPGMGAGLTELLSRLPELRAVVSELASGVGQLSFDAGSGLAGPEFDEFFAFLESDGKQILVDTGRTLGNLADGFASLMVAFGPMTKAYTSGLLDMSRGFEQWAEELDSTEGFQAFSEYIRDNGPDVLQMLGSFGKALVEIAKAAAPVGAIMVPALEALADAIGMIADTPLGTLLILGAALTSLYGRMAALRSIAGGPILKPFTTGIAASGKATKASLPSLAALGTQMTFLGQSSKHASDETKKARAEVRAFGKAVGGTAGTVGLLAFAISPLPEKLGLTNTAMGAMTGMIAGPWGAAVGAGVGLFGDLAAAAQASSEGVDRANQALASADLGTMRSALDYLEDHQGDKSWWEILLGEDSTQVDDEISKMGQLEESIEQLDAHGKSRILTERLLEDAEAADEASEAFADLSKAYEAPELALSQLITRMREWGTAAAEMSTNVQTAIGNGASPDALNSIYERFGADAGLVFEELADGGEAAARRLNREWRRYQNRLGEVDIAIGEVGDNLRDMPMPVLDLQDGNFRRKIRDALDKANVLDAAEVNPFADMNVRLLLQAAAEADRRMGEVEKNGPRPNAVLTGVPQAIDSLNRLTAPRTVKVTPFVTGLQGFFGIPGSADGSFVPKTGLPYADRHPYLLADGEGVTTNRNGETDRFRDVVEAINAGMSRSQVKGMLADGGLAGFSQPGASRRDTREYQRLEFRSTSVPSSSAAASGNARNDAAVLRRLAAIEKAIHHGTRTNSNEQRENRRSTRKGAGSAGRARSRSVVPL